MSSISPNFDVKSIIFSQFWPGDFSPNCWKRPWLTSYDTNAQIYWTVDLLKKHGGMCVYVGIPERLFNVSLHSSQQFLSHVGPGLPSLNQY